MTIGFSKGDVNGIVNVERKWVPSSLTFFRILKNLMAFPTLTSQKTKDNNTILKRRRGGGWGE